MKVKNNMFVTIDAKKDTYIIATGEGKLGINGPFIVLFSMTLGIISELYEKGTDEHKEMLKLDLPIIVKKLAENDFNVDKLNI